MSVKLLFVLVALSSSCFGITPVEQQGFFGSRFSFPSWVTPSIPSGIQAWGGMFSNGIMNQADILNNGVQSAANQVNQLATDIHQQTQDIISKGKEMTRNAVEAVSMPALNAGTRIIIGKFNTLLHMTGRDNVKIDPVKTRLGGFGTFTTSEGTLASLSTLKVDGPLNVTAGLSGIRIAIPLSFDDLHVSFGEYTFNTWGIHINGSLNARIKSNSFVAHVVMQPGIGCQVNVERVEVTRLEDIDVQMTGLCSWCSSVVSYVASFLQGMLQAQVQNAIDTGLRSVLRENSLVLCSIPAVG